jgi:putative hydrolase of the HAD superfamily
MPQFPTGQTLLFDADDTLWENNIYFERAIASFIAWLDHKSHTPAEVRQRLNAIEHETILAHGYGLKSFRRSLVTCFERLADCAATDEHVDCIHNFASIIEHHEIELLPGVGETLADLATRHRIILMTKGDHREQTGKLERSGLAKHFSAVEVVPEKDRATYHAVMERHGLAPQTSWMIGNSPKSDINPSLAAGLHAVFLFHKDTWVLEHAEVSVPPPGQHLIELDGFRKLGSLF